MDFLRALAETFRNHKVQGVIRRMCAYLALLSGLPKKKRSPPLLVVLRGVNKWVNRKHKSRARGIKCSLDGILKD